MAKSCRGSNTPTVQSVSPPTCILDVREILFSVFEHVLSLFTFIELFGSQGTQVPGSLLLDYFQLCAAVGGYEDDILAPMSYASSPARSTRPKKNAAVRATNEDEAGARSPKPEDQPLVVCPICDQSFRLTRSMLTHPTAARPSQSWKTSRNRWRWPTQFCYPLTALATSTSALAVAGSSFSPASTGSTAVNPGPIGSSE